MSSLDQLLGRPIIPIHQRQHQTSEQQHPVVKQLNHLYKRRMKWWEKKVYEFEEAIEAIDSAIEFKNEILCGRECILSNCLAPGTVCVKLNINTMHKYIHNIQMLTYFHDLAYD